MQFKSLIQVAKHFENPLVCTEYLANLRWAGKPVCPHCGAMKVYTLTKKTIAFKCADCRKLFTATKGSIFENSPVPLQKWFMAIFIFTSHKKGISSHQLAKDIHVTQKTAWFMLQRIRYAMQSGDFNHSEGAILEIDETFVGGKEKNKHNGPKIESGIMKGTAHRVNNKIPVAGILERDGRVTAKVVPNVREKSLMPFIRENAKPNTLLMTDEHVGYSKLGLQGYDHRTVSHGKGEYVRGIVHTNGIENFWSLFKRGIIGIYHQVSVKHLDRYVDEFEFRFNSRKSTESMRFENFLSLCNRRLTYSTLIA